MENNDCNQYFWEWLSAASCCMAISLGQSYATSSPVVLLNFQIHVVVRGIDLIHTQLSGNLANIYNIKYIYNI